MPKKSLFDSMEEKSSVSSIAERAKEFGGRLPVTHLNPELITYWHEQPRWHSGEQDLGALKDSIEKNGILQPLIVEEVGKDSFRAIAGARRLQAAKELQAAGRLKNNTVPVIEHRNLTDARRFELAFIENVAREDLSEVERLLGVVKLLKAQFQWNDDALKERLAAFRAFERRQRELGEAREGIATGIGAEDSEYTAVLRYIQSLGVNSVESFLASQYRLLELPNDVLQFMYTRSLPIRTALALVPFAKHPELVTEVARLSVENGWDADEVRRQLRSRSPGEPKPELPATVRKAKVSLGRAMQALKKRLDNRKTSLRDDVDEQQVLQEIRALEEQVKKLNSYLK